MKLDRRQLLSSAALLGGAGLLGLPSGLRAEGNSRRFLFFFCRGGWDTTYFFAPAFDTVADMPEGSQLATTGDIDWVEGEERPAIRSFMDAYGSELCLVNGLEVRSITHDRCQRLILTGSAGSDADDWGAWLAASGGSGLRLPHVVVEGPSFTAQHGAHVVRVGRGGQLPALIDGTALEGLDQEVWAPASSAAVEEMLVARGRELAARESSLVAELAAQAAEKARGLEGLDISLDVGDLFSDQVDLALDCFEQGLSRSALVTFDGLWESTFDTHADNVMQGRHFDLLFEELAALRQQLGERGLLEDTTVVVFSEMGRHPQLNDLGGKLHWTSTSAMLFGAGVRGGQVIGAYDEELFGLPVDLVSGEQDPGGTPLLAAHLGATLLALGGVDSLDQLGVEPIQAAIAD